jgi:hypothetical protein
VKRRSPGVTGLTARGSRPLNSVALDPLSFDRLPRDELVAKARSLGVERPELMTRVELGDEIVRRTQTDPGAQRQARGWLGVARDLVASVVESGLNLPDAAAIIRGDRGDPDLTGPSPVATVTLAEIYATQGHADRALKIVEEILAREPEHQAAASLRDRLRDEPPRRRGAPAPSVPPLSVPPEPEPPPTPSAKTPEPVPTLPVSEPRGPEAPAGAERPAGAEASAATYDAAADVERPPVESAEAEITPHPRAVRVPVLSAAFAAAEVESEAVAQAEFAPPAPAAAGEPAAGDAPPITPPSETAPTETAPTETAPTETAPTETASAPSPTLVVIRGREGHPLLCWDVPEQRPSRGQLELECLGFIVNRSGTVRREVAVPLAAPRGRFVLKEFDARTVVRAALGSREAGAFIPLAIASELFVDDGNIEVRFRPPLATPGAATPAERALVAEFAS